MSICIFNQSLVKSVIMFLMERKILDCCRTHWKSFFQDFLGPEEAARLSSESPDLEFEGMGDYEESIFADWRQPRGKGDAGESNI